MCGVLAGPSFAARLERANELQLDHTINCNQLVVSPVGRFITHTAPELVTLEWKADKYACVCEYVCVCVCVCVCVSLFLVLTLDFV